MHSFSVFSFLLLGWFSVSKYSEEKPISIFSNITEYICRVTILNTYHLRMSSKVEPGRWLQRPFSELPCHTTAWGPCEWWPPPALSWVHPVKISVRSWSGQLKKQATWLTLALGLSIQLCQAFSSLSAYLQPLCKAPGQIFFCLCGFKTHAWLYP